MSTVTSAIAGGFLPLNTYNSSDRSQRGLEQKDTTGSWITTSLSSSTAGTRLKSGQVQYSLHPGLRVPIDRSPSGRDYFYVLLEESGLSSLG